MLPVNVISPLVFLNENVIPLPFLNPVRSDFLIVAEKVLLPFAFSDGVVSWKCRSLPSGLRVHVPSVLPEPD